MSCTDDIHINGATHTTHPQNWAGFAKHFYLNNRGLYLYQSPWAGVGNVTVGRASWLITCRYQVFNLDFSVTSSTGNMSRVAGITGDGSYVDLWTFTGQHKSKSINDTIYNNIDDYIGLICCSTGEYATYNFDTETCNSNKEGITINDSMPVIDLTTTKKDKKVYGVISNKEDTDRTMGYGRFESVLPNSNDCHRVIVNSIGEGAIWIVNTNGNLENGDYIQSSDVIGHGEKQDSEFLANYTVAKITCDCDFTLNSEDYECVEFVDATSGNTYRKAFVGCTYHCG